MHESKFAVRQLWMSNSDTKLMNSLVYWYV